MNLFLMVYSNIFTLWFVKFNKIGLSSSKCNEITCYQYCTITSIASFLKLPPAAHPLPLFANETQNSIQIWSHLKYQGGSGENILRNNL